MDLTLIRLKGSLFLHFKRINILLFLYYFDVLI